MNWKNLGPRGSSLSGVTVARILCGLLSIRIFSFFWMVIQSLKKCFPNRSQFALLHDIRSGLHGVIQGPLKEWCIGKPTWTKNAISTSFWPADQRCKFAKNCPLGGHEKWRYFVSVPVVGIPKKAKYVLSFLFDTAADTQSLKEG